MVLRIRKKGEKSNFPPLFLKVSPCNVPANSLTSPVEGGAWHTHSFKLRQKWKDFKLCSSLQQTLLTSYICVHLYAKSSGSSWPQDLCRLRVAGEKRSAAKLGERSARWALRAAGTRGRASRAACQAEFCFACTVPNSLCCITLAGTKRKTTTRSQNMSAGEE